MGSVQCCYHLKFQGKISYDYLIEGMTFREESDEQTGFKEKVIIESRDKTKNPAIKILGPKGEELRVYNLPWDHTSRLSDPTTMLKQVKFWQRYPVQSVNQATSPAVCRV
jgi:hypothetical protein